VLPVTSFPFQQGRSVSFANAKLLERREAANKRSGPTEQEHFTLLPTPYLVVNLTENEAADQQFVANALDLPRLDKMVFEARDSPMLQHLSVKAKVRASVVVFKATRQLTERNGRCRCWTSALSVVVKHRCMSSGKWFYWAKKLTTRAGQMRLSGARKRRT
jgi:hypothetical protein